MTTASPTPSRHPALRVRGSPAIVLAVLANVPIVLGVETLAVAPGVRALTIPPVAFLSALGAVGVTVVYWLVHRTATAPDRTFCRVAGTALLLSFVPDLAVLAVDPAATPFAVVILVAMPVVVAVVAVGLLAGWRADR